MASTIRCTLFITVASAAAIGCGEPASSENQSGSGGIPAVSGAGGLAAAGGGGETLSGGAPAAGGSFATTGGVTSSAGGTPPGSSGGTAGSSSGGAGESGGENGGAGSGGSETGDTGIFPPVTDPGQKGPFTPVTEANTGPSSGYTAIHPTDLGKDGVKHPIVIWGNGALGSPPLYKALLDHLASHGFAILAYNTTPQGPQMTAALDWMIAEGARQGSPYAGKLDTAKVAAMGHSAGSLASFQIAADPRLTTTMHLNGGTFSPHTDIENLKAPAAFLCGDPGGDGLLVGDVARPNCDIDFTNATTAVWYGAVKGASHMTITGAATDPLMAKGFLAATAGWLRWQLAGDQTMKRLFVGSACDLCTNTAVFDVQQKNLQ